MTKAIVNDYAEKNNIFINNFNLPKTKALCIEIGNKYYIGIDEKQFNNSQEATTALIHEIGHCESGALYNTNTSALQRAKCEYQADKWAITHFIDRDVLFDRLRQNISLWEIAEEIGVTEHFLQKAVEFYFIR